tara:strand:+ start:92 stop:469 length:378 start_codon:yes stop_codon:yes gene_type:complete
MVYDARNTEFGTKRTVVGAHYGLKDWLAQRVTAIILASYSIILLITFFLSGNNGFLRWSMIFQVFWVKIATLLATVAICYHAWVGVRDIWMDYIKPVSIRLGLQIFTIVWLLICGIWVFEIMWKI